MKPLFIPLKAQWFEAFECGGKSHEYRAYGPRWDENSCCISRPVTLSYGYSGRRLHGIVASFAKIAIQDAPAEAQALYAGKAEHLAVIGLRLSSDTNKF